MDARVRVRLKTLFQLFASFKPSLQPDLLWQVFVVADLEAATLVGRRSEECRLDSPSALGGAALGRRTANAGADAWSRRDVGPRCRHRRQTSPNRARCGAPRAAATTGSPRRRPSSRYPPPPPLQQPPAARRGEEAPKDHLAAARRGGEGEGAGRRSEEGRRGGRGGATPCP